MVSKFNRRIILSGALAAGAVSLGAAATAFAEGEAETQALKLPLIGPVGAERIHVMSFNVRVAVDKGARSWEARLPRILKVVRAEQPTILGTQEGRLHQIKDLAGELPGYGCVRRGREKDGTGETCAVFFRKDRLEKLDEGHRWLSKTPTAPGSISWGAKHPRMMTWVKLRDRATGRKFLHVNVHFDHASALAREKSAKLVRAWLRDRDFAAVITGDFNADAGSVPHGTMIAGDFHDAWNHKDKRITPDYRTANGWNPVPGGGRRIDWIIGSKQVKVHKAGVNTWVTKFDNTPSDHWAVQAVLSL